MTRYLTIVALVLTWTVMNAWSQPSTYRLIFTWTDHVNQSQDVTYNLGWRHVPVAEAGQHSRFSFPASQIVEVDGYQRSYAFVITPLVPLQDGDIFFAAAEACNATPECTGYPYEARITVDLATVTTVNSLASPGGFGLRLERVAP